MANELSATIGVVFNATDELSPAVDSLEITMTGTQKAGGRITVTTTEEILPKGDMTTAVGAILVLKNLDATNFVNLLHASGGTVIQKYKPGECWACRLGSGVTVPYVISDTTTCLVDFALYQA